MKKRKIQIYPTVLTKRWDEYRYRIIETSKYFSAVQIDVMDGHFVKNRTYGNFKKINSLKPKNLFFDVQLMVADPLASMVDWSEVADRYIIHRESVKDPVPYIKLARALKRQIGLAINPETPVSKLIPFIKMIDMALIMTVHPGKSGSTFIPKTLSKIRMLRKRFPTLPIEVDGGITLDNVSSVVKAGATIIVAGHYFWEHKNLLKAKQEMLKKLNV